MTALASAIRPLWHLLEQFGQPADEVFRNAGIEPETLGDPYARIPIEPIRAAWLRASSRIADGSFGVLAGDLWHPSMFGPLGYAWLASDTLRDAFERISRYTTLVAVGSEVCIREEEDGLVSVVLRYEHAPYTIPALADGIMSVIVKIARINYGESLNPVRVRFFHSSPPEPGRYFEYFRCPVEFDQKEDSLTFTSEVMNAPLMHADPKIAALHDSEMTRMISGLRQGSLSERVKATILEALPSGDISQERVARLLGTSERTLHRQLKGENSTFRGLLDEVRRDVGMRYLADGTMTVGEVAFLLGFAEPSSLTRAWRRWTGSAPSQARAKGVQPVD